MAGTYDVFPVCETSPAAETSGMGWPLFEGSMLYASVRPQAKGKQRTTKTTERYFYLTQHQLQFWEHQKGTSQSRPTCVATVASMKRVDFVALQRKQGNGNEEGHHARLITVQEGGQRDQLHFWTKNSGELQSFIDALKKATDGTIEMAYVRPSRMVPLKGFTVESTQSRLAPLPGELPLQLGQKAIIHDTEPLTSNKVWRGTTSSGDHGLVDPDSIKILDLHSEPWFFEGVSRESAETFLNGQPHGSFMVRTTDDELSLAKLSVRPEGQIYHYKIQEKDGKFSITPRGEACNSVSELINFYKSKPLEGLSPSTLLKFYPSRTQSFSLEEWDIHPSEVFYELGEGEIKTTPLSKLVLGTWRDNQAVLVDILNEKLTREDIGRFENMIKLHSSLKHDKIVRLLGICWSRQPRSIITEYPSRGDLASYVQKSTVGPKSRWMMLSHICSAMEYLEDLGVVHNDLTCKNCLVSTDPEEVAKVAGFHNARRRSDAKSGSWFGNEEPTSKSDVYYFGVIMYEVATAFKHPFSKEKITPGSGFFPPFPPHLMSDDQQSMIKECLKRKRDERPSFGQLFVKMRSLGLCKNESYYSEIKGYIKEENQEEETLQPSTLPRHRDRFPIPQEASEPDCSDFYGETSRPSAPPRLPIRQKLSDVAAKRHETSSTPTQKMYRSTSEVIPSYARVGDCLPRTSGSGTALYDSKRESSSEYIQFMAPHVLAEEKEDEEEQKQDKMIQNLQSKLHHAQKEKEDLQEELNRLEKAQDIQAKLYRTKVNDYRSLAEEKSDWEDYEKPLPLNLLNFKQTSKPYSDHPFEAPGLRFDVTHRGETYVSAFMDVAINVPRGAIRRNESITLSCHYFSGDKERLGLGSSASIVSSVYELSPSAAQTVFRKRVQISVPHGVVLESLGQKFQMKVMISQTNEDESDMLCWEPVPFKYCAFASGSAVARINHFSLLAVIIEKVQAGVEFFQKSWQLSKEPAVDSDSKVVSDDKRDPSKQCHPEILAFGDGIYLRYHAAVWGPNSTQTEGDANVQMFYIYCYYGIPEQSKLIQEQESRRFPPPVMWDLAEVFDIDPYNQAVTMKILSSSDQVSFAPDFQDLEPKKLDPNTSPVPVMITATFENDPTIPGLGVCLSRKWHSYNSGQLTLTFDLKSLPEYPTGRSATTLETRAQPSSSNPLQEFSVVGASGPVVVGSSPTLIQNIHQTVYLEESSSFPTPGSPSRGLTRPPATAALQHPSDDEIGGATEGSESDLFPIPLTLAKNLSKVLDAMLEQHNDWRSLAYNLRIPLKRLRELEKMAVNAISGLPSPTMTVLRSWIQMVGQPGVSIGFLYKAVREIDPPCVSAMNCFEGYISCT